MIYPPEARILDECVIRYENLPEYTPPENLLQYEFMKDNVEVCAEDHDIHLDHLHNLESNSVFQTNQVEYCHQCDLPSDLCMSTTHQREIVTRYTLNIQQFVEEWIDWVEESDVLLITNKNRITDTQWTLSAEFNGEEITFQLFFSASELREFDFRIEQFEFGIAFLDYRHIPNNDQIFSWYEPLVNTDGGTGENFINNLQNQIEEYQDAISARFVSEDDVQGFQREMRNGIWKYLESRGYSPHREISRNATGYF